MSKTLEIHKNKESELIEALKQDDGLKKDVLMLYTSYAGFFEEDLSNNLYLTSIELNDKYNTENPSSWQRFLRHPVVKKYKQQFIDERAESVADTFINKGELKPNEALKLKTNIEKNRKGDDNSNLVVFFLPQKDYLGGL